MPFAAARALAATFCWPIRYALTPLFGPGFPDTCTKPTDPAFQDYKLSREVIRHCQAEVRSWTQPHLGTHLNPAPNISHHHLDNYTHAQSQPQSSRRQPKSMQSAEPEPSPIDNDITPKALRARFTRPDYAESDSSDSNPTPRATKHHKPANTLTWRAVNSPTPHAHMHIHAHSSTHSSASPAPSSVLFSVAGSEEIGSGSGTSKRSFSDVGMDRDEEQDVTMSNPASPDMSRSRARRPAKKRKMHKIGEFDDAELEAAQALVLFAGQWGSAAGGA